MHYTGKLTSAEQVWFLQAGSRWVYSGSGPDDQGFDAAIPGMAIPRIKLINIPAAEDSMAKEAEKPWYLSPKKMYRPMKLNPGNTD